MLTRRLVQSHRALARVALYLAPLALLGASWATLRSVSSRPSVAGLTMAANLPDREEVKLFREYLRIDTTAETGDALRAVELLARVLGAEGIPSEIIRTGERRANLWAVLEGADPKALVLHHHVDTDPIHPNERWTVDPFGGELRPPWIYGRGAFDMKSVAIAQLAAFLDLHRRKVPLRRSVALLATDGEEIGSWLGTRWILRNRPDVVARLGTVLTEGGAVEALDSQTVKYWGTEVCQKRFVNVRVCDRSRERLEELRVALDTQPEDLRVDLLPVRRALAPQVREFLVHYGPTRDLAAHRTLLSAPEALLEGEAFFQVPLYVRSMLRNEVAPFSVEAAPGGGYSLLLILHVAPGFSDADAREELLPAGLLGDLAVAVDAPPEGPWCSPADDPTFLALDRFMARRNPQWRHGPLVVPWAATDARFFRSAGIPAYGFSPFLIVSSDTRRMSSADERMPAPAFVDGVALYRDLVAALVAE